MPATIPSDAHRLLDEPTFAHLVTLKDDGGPQVTPVWIGRDGDTVFFNTSKGRLKERNLGRDYPYLQRGEERVTPDAVNFNPAP